MRRSTTNRQIILLGGALIVVSILEKMEFMAFIPLWLWVGIGVLVLAGYVVWWGVRRLQSRG